MVGVSRPSIEDVSQVLEFEEASSGWDLSVEVFCLFAHVEEEVGGTEEDTWHNLVALEEMPMTWSGIEQRLSFWQARVVRM